MAFKVVILVCMLVVSMTGVVKVAEAQIVLNKIEGTIFCTPNANIGVNGTTTTPVFPNASVNLKCLGSIEGSATTNTAGLFTFYKLYPANVILSNCTVVLVSPLSGCNSTLPAVAGGLSAPLKYVGNILGTFYFVTLSFATSATSVLQ